MILLSDDSFKVFNVVGAPAEDISATLSVTSLTFPAGFCYRLVFRGAEHWMYIYIYENFRVADLAWDSAITWYLALIGVDFCYYWVHRASHGKPALDF